MKESMLPIYYYIAKKSCKSFKWSPSLIWPRDLRAYSYFCNFVPFELLTAFCDDHKYVIWLQLLFHLAMDKERFLRSLLPTSSNGEASVEEEGTINYLKLEETTAIINND